MDEPLPLPNRLRLHDKTGRRYGRLVVLGFGGYRRQPSGNRSSMWLCRCECGTRKVVHGSDMRLGKIKSCGCLRAEVTAKLKLSHGSSKRPEYQIWKAIIKRCGNPNDTAFERYGGRGIAVCDRWCRSFNRFFGDMGARPSKEHSIERRNNDGNYTPSNCFWATRIEQARNKRDSRWITFRGKTQCVAAWAEELGVSVGLLLTRLNSLGWSVEKALSTAPGPCTLRQITFRGETLSLTNWARRIGITYTSLTDRLGKRGWTLEKALTTPPLTGPNRPPTTNGGTSIVSELVSFG